MTILINSLEYSYENLGGGVYRVMVNADGGDQPGWHHLGRVRSNSIEDLPEAIEKASSSGWPYVEKPFAAKLKQARQAAGLSQSELARELGVSTYTVKSWESGRREPPIIPALTQGQILARLEEALSHEK